MCTVTIIPTGGNDFVLTTNRDEAPNRVSLQPDFYHFQDAKLLFPKDKVADGTWIGVSEKKRVVCVLNGGFEFHQRQNSYRKSRGVIAKEVMVAENIIEAIENYDLTDIEPFTMVVADWNSNLKFLEWVWDGRKKHINHLPLEPKIWSSSTLYTKEMKAERLQWFEDFKRNNVLNAYSLKVFHAKGGDGNSEYGVIMDRGFVKTTSITQIEKQNEVVEMHYKNLENNKISKITFNLPQAVYE